MTAKNQPATTAIGPSGCPVLHGFDPLSPAQVEDPGPLTAVARREAPVFFDPDLDMYVVTRHEDVVSILHDYSLFAGLPMTAYEPPAAVAELLPAGFIGRQPGMLAWLDPDEHGRVRKLSQKAFTRRAAAAKEDEIRATFEDTLAGFLADGEADLATAFARKVPMRVVCATLGIDTANETDLHRWVADTMRMMGDPNLDEPALIELAHSQAEFEAFVQKLIDERRASPLPEGDLLSDLLRWQGEENERRLDDNEIFATVVLSITAGGDTSVNLISQLTRRLLIEGDLWDRCKDDTVLLEACVEEELRICNVGRLALRRATRDAVIGGIKIPAGSIVGLHLWSTGHDEEVFERPEEFDPERGGLDRHLGFGRGVKFCMGAPLARLETRVALEVLLERLPNPRLMPGHELEHEPSIAIPSVKSGLLVAWDA